MTYDQVLECIRGYCRIWLNQEDTHSIIVSLPVAGVAVNALEVNLESGYWHCFGTGKRGTNIISLAAHVFGITEQQATLKIEDTLAWKAK